MIQPQLKITPKTMMKTAKTDAFREPVVGANRQLMFYQAHPF